MLLVSRRPTRLWTPVWAGMMLSSLLAVLFLTSPSLAMIPSYASRMDSSQEDRTSPDPNTHWAVAGDGGVPAAQAGPLAMPPLGKRGLDSTTFEASSAEVLPIPDPTICDWLLNAPVPVPIDQIPVFCLCSHCEGSMGPKGERGDRGPPGAAGSPGGRGMTGFRGHPGFGGPQGVKGQKGELGEQGQTGSSGFPGMKGARGFKGDKGDGGLIGPAGPLGPQGEAGECPASCGGALGPPGPQGVSGLTGARGLPGVQGLIGSKGLKGERGDEGKPGIPGLNGQKGSQGEQGGCECTDGEDGADGAVGEKGAKGEDGNPGDQGLDGSRGQKGVKGEPGVGGLPGPCSTVFQSAFSACLNQSFPAQNLPVPFPRVLTNRQGHFDRVRGVYTAPVNGSYVFSFHLAVAGRVLKVGLFHNFSPSVRVTEGADQSTASHSVALHLTQGDRVWLQVKDATTNGMYTDGERSSTFSGYLLHPDSCGTPRGKSFIPTMKELQEEYSWEGPSGTAAPSP
ncbi:hypothetical protein fugu_013905 [Takifugu bimaculatus]|uniref:C1q domain-containing protein n=1 Tax=Takifugu bimaculatus TaxID=433685 RepID=A0A4Z2BZQ8_9TELE|nr:hypothetical protein fugu_013905 [Takifugu bimaculatus]